MYGVISIAKLTRSLSLHLAHSVDARPGEENKDSRFDIAAIILFGALAGASAGTWTGGLQLLYVAVKVPFLLLCTLVIGLPSMALFGRLIGCPIGFSDCANLALASIARTAVVLGALSPATFYFALTLPANGQSVYRAVVLSQVFAFAIAGFVGVTALKGQLARVVQNKAKHRRVVILWLTIYSFVGAQLTWMLRPFLSSPHLPVEFFRSYGERIGVDSNFYLSVYLLVKHALAL